MEQSIGRWEDEGGPSVSESEWKSIRLLGSPAQIEWAESIRERVNSEFDRVALSLRSTALRQDRRKRSETEAIIAILEEKRAEVLSKDQAGYFIHDWQEIDDQVRLMIARDSRYHAIRARKTSGALNAYLDLAKQTK